MRKMLLNRILAAFVLLCLGSISTRLLAVDPVANTNAASHLVAPGVTNLAVGSTNLALPPANVATVATNKTVDSGAIDPEKREFRAGDIFRYWVEEDPNNRSSDGMQVKVTSAGTMLCPVSMGYQNYITVECSGKKLAEIRKEIKRQLEEKYYVHATVRLDLDAVLKGPDAAGAGGSATFFGEMGGKIPLPEGQKVWLSQAIASMHPSDWADLAKVKVNRKDGKTIRVNVKDILEKNQRKLDVELQDGDMIQVPAVGWHF